MTARTFPLTTESRADDTAAERRDHVSWKRLLWVAPLTVVAAVLVPWLPPGLPVLAAAVVAIVVGVTNVLGRRTT